MKNNRLNTQNTANLTILQNKTSTFSLKNIVFLPLISIFLVFGLSANSYAIQQKLSIGQSLTNVTETTAVADLDRNKIEVAFNQEDRQQLRDEMRQQWNGGAENAQKTWKQLGAGDREQMRRDMVQTNGADLPAPAAGAVRR